MHFYLVSGNKIKLPETFFDLRTIFIKVTAPDSRQLAPIPTKANIILLRYHPRCRQSVQHAISRTPTRTWCSALVISGFTSSVLASMSPFAISLGSVSRAAVKLLEVRSKKRLPTVAQLMYEMEEQQRHAKEREMQLQEALKAETDSREALAQEYDAVKRLDGSPRRPRMEAAEEDN